MSSVINLAAQYQVLLDRIVDLAWIIDASGQIRLVNTACYNYTGRSLLSHTPCYLWDMLPELQREQIMQQWQKNSLQLWQQQQLKDARNKYSPWDLRIEPLMSEDLPLWLVTASRSQIAPEAIAEPELADYKRKELKLQRSVEFVRRIMESSQDCIKVLDLDARLLYMNDGGQQIMEIDDFEKIQYAPWLNFWTDCARQAAEQAFATAKAGKVGRFDGYCATAKGTPKWWEVIVTPMLDEDGEVREILSVSRDITVRKTAEEVLQQRNQELDRFTYVVTHDLKAPLRGISNLADWIAEDAGDRLPPESLEHLMLMQQRVQRMNALIDGLLQFSRIGREKLPTESVELTELLQETIDSLSPPAGFAITHTRSISKIATKRLFLSQVLSNLISNAIKHHDRDRGKIEISIEDCDTHYQFAIADDGPGIDSRDRERIFQIFQTLKNKTSTTNTGIGLALVTKIIEQEGGKLWLEENTPRGSRFCFTWKKIALA